MSLKWTTALRNYIRHHFLTMTDKELAHRLTVATGKAVTWMMVAEQRRHMGLRKRGRGEVG